MEKPENMLPVIEEDTSHLGLVLDHFGIRQKEAAEGVGVDASMITKWKKGSSTLGVSSKSMKPLVDFILSPSRKLSEADHRWLRARFAEAGLEYRYRNLGELRNTLTNYLANDGSLVGQQDIARQRLYAQEFFSLGGLNEILLFLEDELARCSEGHSVMFAGFSCGIEIEPAFHEAVATAVSNGLRLKILMGWNAASEDGDLFAQLYLPELTHPNTLVRNASQPIDVMFDSGMTTTVLIAGRLCMHITGRAGTAPYVACVIRQPDYLREAESGFTRAMAAGSAVFENPRDTTPRYISGKMSAMYRSSADILVASDGLNPLFMSPDAFERFLMRKGTDSSERAWRLEAFCAEQQALEYKLSRGGVYHEMSSALDAPSVRAEGVVCTNGQTFYDAQASDLEAALDILQGYMRFASLFPGFKVRFVNPSREMSQGLWMMATGSQDAPAFAAMPAEYVRGLIVCRRGFGIQQLYSEDARLVRTARECFEDAWSRIRYRVYHNGRMMTNDDETGSADASRNVFFIRERIEWLKRLIEERKA